MTALAVDVRELSIDEIDAVAGGPLPAVIIVKVALKAVLLGSVSCSVTIKS
ncbi:hypothetical protein EIB18_05385 [Caulobacter vibrioides]|uniref:Uncharacterized protein n=1 Tax=Caulobacter vibrioides (strain NA1000 / CB15N) TaxID=565050 RepID=A0A0H3IWD5_CAUVN|nr:hypothetical protein [Caulobacter vibrioides]YP_009020517.1 hypothetical protein CCNA_03945 [Caulobacter vibrioides NA1000]AHI88548.1 hypothetical protein CCNA_03945 [Caulobacter vibrioides NA1000]AVH77071.1 hypothetical protein CA607_20340 [Caulobacter vibrioides]AZH12192.1 hypothetical protein EIB18_05385 [Caulobacter vibrioides]QXZ53074.1 hypothetical protein KZH45_05230 [Caulobacter vibrioides]